jgi:hypothetical protein
VNRKQLRTFSIRPELSQGIDKLVESGRFRSATSVIERCLEEHFNPYPDLPGQEALKKAEELELAARGYRVQAGQKIISIQSGVYETAAPVALSVEDEAVLKASLSPKKEEKDGGKPTESTENV